jgi:redox-sensitive bicupin YhaK (pirin superfamily)
MKHDLTTTARAADHYRHAVRAACDRRDILSCLERACDADPEFGVAALDRAVLAGSPVPRVGRPPTRWERQHLDIMRAVAEGDVPRASGLLAEHLAEFRSDPIAVVAVTNATAVRQSGAMSGPVTTQDSPPVATGSNPEPTCVELTESHVTRVGSITVRRALPRRGRRTVGGWCFVDHMGPLSLDDGAGLAIGPHPHTGLQTVTWLVAGEALHRDSLGSEQLIRPGQLNLMTAGRGVSHAEESTGTSRGDIHGVQLWVAQPDSTRHGEPAFEHHPGLPTVELAAGAATVLVGAVDGLTSPARRDTEHVGIDLDLRAGTSVLPAEPSFEYALVVLDGAVAVDGTTVEPGHLGYLGLGRDELLFVTIGPARALLIGGVPFPDPVIMWWNFVARNRDEITAAYRDWQTGHDRFGITSSELPRIPGSPPPWAPG